MVFCRRHHIECHSECHRDGNDDDWLWVPKILTRLFRKVWPSRPLEESASHDFRTLIRCTRRPDGPVETAILSARGTKPGPGAFALARQK
jgi:hypothetical protein